MSKELAPERVSDDAGVGLVEIVVAMLMLALLSLTFLPILIQGIQQASANATRATATQLIHDKMEDSRAQEGDCSDVGTVAGVSNVTDPRGIVLVTTTVVGACPGTYPGTVAVTATTKTQGSTITQATATTLVFVGQA